MKKSDLYELVRKLMSEGKSILEAIKIAENTGLFDEKVIDDFWDDLNGTRTHKSHHRKEPKK